MSVATIVIVVALSFAVGYALASIVTSRLGTWVDRRSLLGRLGPVAELVVWLAIAAAVGLALLSVGPGAFVAVGVPVAILLGVGLGALRDYVTGVVMLSEGRIQRGEVIEITDVSGVVTSMTRRGAVLESGHEEIFVPWTAVGRSLIRKRRAGSRHHQHTFEMPAPAGLETVDAVQLLQRRALLHPWVSLSSEPVIEPVSATSIRVTCEGRDAAGAYDFERAMRSDG